MSLRNFLNVTVFVFNTSCNVTAIMAQSICILASESWFVIGRKYVDTAMTSVYFLDMLSQQCTHWPMAHTACTLAWNATIDARQRRGRRDVDNAFDMECNATIDAPKFVHFV